MRRLDGLTHGGRWMPTLWLLLATASLLLLAGDGRPAWAASTLRQATVSHAAAPLADGAESATTSAPASRPDFRVAFVRLDVGQAGDPLSYTVQVRNDGAAGGAVRVTTMLPPDFSNVRVNAPGFACSRQFTPSGSDAGTLVTCTRNELAGGAAAEITVEASMPGTAGPYRLLATADPRGEVPEADEANNQVAATVTVGA